MRSVAARCECANEDNDPLPIDPLPLPPFDLQLNAEGHQPEGWTMADWKRHKQMCYGTMETKFRDRLDKQLMNFQKLTALYYSHLPAEHQPLIYRESNILDPRERLLAVKATI